MQSFLGTTTDRQLLRQRFWALRRTQKTDARQRALEAALLPWLSARSFHCAGVYAPTAGEPDLVPALSQAVTVKALAYPVVDDVAARSMHYEVVTDETPMVPGAYGIPAPVNGVRTVPDLIFAPCVAVTPTGFRLGNGGGYFDRWLAALPENRRPVTVAVAWEALVTTAFVPEVHDIALDWIATEAGVRRSGFYNQDDTVRAPD